MGDTLQELNSLLGRELGRRSNGHPIFAWKNSDALFWPAFHTGRKILRKVEFQVPIIGGGTESVTMETPVPEYRRDLQVDDLDTWVMTKHLTAEELIFGAPVRHGEYREGPSDEKLRELWQSRFPGAHFPGSGWRIPVGAIDPDAKRKFATLPRLPGGLRFPNLADTQWFINTIREQTRLAFALREQELFAAEDAIVKAKDQVIYDAVRDAIPAGLNPRPGTRGSWVSFPWTKRDRL